jgi:hypothetical protein
MPGASENLAHENCAGKFLGYRGKVILKKKGRMHDDLCKGKWQGNS